MLLNETENQRAHAFAMEHYEQHGKTAAVNIEAYQTGIGWGVEAICPYCKKRKDITDSSNW